MSNENILAELKPCGYILATSQYKFFGLKCLYCDKKYGYWTMFLQHLKDFHIDNQSETQWLFDCAEETLDPDSENVECSTQCDRLTDIFAKEDVMPSTNIFDIEDVLIEKDVNDRTNTKVAVEKSVFSISEVMNENLDDSLHDFTDFTEALPHACQNFTKLHIDLKEENYITQKFIEIYKKFSHLWRLEQVISNEDNAQSQDMHDMRKCLSEENIRISTEILEEALNQVHLQYRTIASRLEEGIEISDIEEKYYDMCSFLKTSNELSEANYDSESGETISDSNDNKFTLENYSIEDSQNGFDIMDGEAFQNSLIDRQSLVKFSTRNKITSDFIQCLHDQPCLWDPQASACNDSNLHSKAIKKLQDFFQNNYNLRLTERKINSEINRVYKFYKRCLCARQSLNPNRKYYFERCEFLALAELEDVSVKRRHLQGKISFSVMDEFTLGFIDFCAMHPVLWDRTHSQYSILNARKVAYEEITKNLLQIYNVEFSNDEIYHSISRLKRHYKILQCKKQLNESMAPYELELFERCSFLENSNNLQCDICGKIFRSYSTLQTHLLKSHSIGELPIKCDYCEQRFAHPSLKKEHEVRAHTKEFEWFCPYCSKGFANRRDMEMHQMVHTGEHKSVCEHCGKGFRLKNQMTEHVKVIHERLRRFKCTMCPKDFVRKRQLDDHIRAHLNIRDKICDICGKGFTNTHGLFRHKQLHSDIKKYECKVCGDRFYRLCDLYSHRKRKHEAVPKQKNNASQEEEDDANAFL